MRAVITVIGKDTVGIMAKISGECAEYKANIIDVTQTVMQDMFAMIMLVEIDELSKPFAEMVEHMEKVGENVGVKVHVMHEDIFNTMHHV